MTFAALSAVVAIACVLASARRLSWAVAPTALDAKLVIEWLRDDQRGPARFERLRAAVERHPECEWERDLFAAFAQTGHARDALVNEQLTEFDWRVQRGSRVPRVCASIATSAGFLCASIVVLRGLSAFPDDGEAGPLLGSVIGPALDAFAAGIAGTSFCVAVVVRARRAAQDRLKSVDRLVEALEGCLGR